MNQHIYFSVSRTVFLLICLCTCETVLGVPEYISGVPDWDQPVFAAAQATGGPWGAWCVPAATANIIGYYDDKGVAGIGDGQPFPTTPPWKDPVWQDETADANGGLRSDPGWYFNTNDLGLGSPSTGHRGTKLQHIMDGATGSGGLIGGTPGPPSGYFPTRGQNNITVGNLGADRMDPVVYGDFNTYGGAQITHDYALGFSEIMLSIGASQPLLAHFDHFILAGKTRASDLNLGDYDWAPWGTPPTFPSTDDASGEVWDPNQGLGHTVTVVGFWLGSDSNNPLTPTDAIIVHDNKDGTLASDPLPLVIPWTGSPWMGLTIINHGLMPPTVLDPNGSEALIADTNNTITWQNTGTIADIAVEYSTNNGSAWSNVSPPNVGNSGSYLWRTPVVDANQCLVRVSSAVTPALFDVSDDVFTIYQCTLSYDLNGNCFVDMYDFSLLALEWAQCGNPFDSNCLP